jgi:hypothetical protein
MFVNDLFPIFENSTISSAPSPVFTDKTQKSAKKNNNR